MMGSAPTPVNLPPPTVFFQPRMQPYVPSYQTQQPMITGQEYGVPWRYGLFNSCFSSLPDCLLSFCCPPCYAAYASYVAEEGVLMSLMQCLFYPFGLCCLRPRVRDYSVIEGSIAKDLCVACCCPFCTATQIKRQFVD